MHTDARPTTVSTIKQTLSEVVGSLSGYDPNALPVAQAQQIISKYIVPIQGVETVSLHGALGRILSRDIVSPINVPAHDNSAMDGYAFCFSDLNLDAATTLDIIGTTYAGRAFEGKVAAGECVNIMTGGVMPAGCDTVIPQELSQSATATTVVIPANIVKAGDNRRFKGEDLEIGKPALSKGKKLSPADLGLLASLGIGEVAVQRRLRVAFFSTGDELRSIGEPLDEGCIYDSNRYTIYGMLTRLGCDIIDMGVVKDDPVTMELAFRHACESADAIITSGGVSVGAADYTKQMMAKLGDVTFWKIGMRPGRPMAFGQITSNNKHAYLFGLPGNPVAVMVTFYFFVRDALLHMMGAEAAALPLVSVVSQEAIRKKSGRTEYQRGVVSKDSGGKLQVRITGSQGSGILRSMSEANCMVVLHHEQGGVKAGEFVDVVLFEGLI